MSGVTKFSCNVCTRTLAHTRCTPCSRCAKRHHISCGCTRRSGESFTKQQNTPKNATIERIEENSHNVETRTQAAELSEFLAKFKTELTTVLENQLADVTSDLTSKLDSIAKVVNEIPALTNTIFGLRDSLDAIEKKLKDHDELLDELKTNQQTVVNQTTTFNNVLVSAIENGSNVTAINEDDDPAVEVSPTSDANTTIQSQTATHTRKPKRKRRRKRTPKNTSLHEVTHDSCSSIILDSVDAEGVGVERNELIVSGIVDCACANVQARDVAFEILHTVHPDLSTDDIVSAIQFPSKCLNQGGSATAASTHASHTNSHFNANKQACRDLQDCAGPTPPILVTLANRDLVQTVLCKKRDIKGFCTDNLNLDALGGMDAGSVPPSRIYIGENLPSHKYNEFKELRSAAKRLGFEFTWHRAGRYFARYAEGERAFSLTSVQDLEVIARTLYTRRTVDTEQ